MNCFKGQWSLTCRKDFTINHVHVKKGAILDVKDKFPGNDGSVESGVWQVKDGHGGLFNLSLENRLNLFESMTHD